MAEDKKVCGLLDEVNSPNDIKNLDIEQLKTLSQEIRDFLIENVSKTGGHLASNLGVVELTLALHKTFDTPNDKIVWDVGHQSYVHKILTGRKTLFNTLRQIGGISGFPKNSESEHDCFNTGHSSTSISAALGLAKARDILKENYSVVAVIGDGALTGGMAFEALNDAGRSPNNFIIVLNDNEMSISKNVGGMSRYLSKIRTQPIYYKTKEDVNILLNKIPAVGEKAIRALTRLKGIIKYAVMPGVIFEELGFKYLGPIDGHNITELNTVFSRAKETKGPVLIHVCTAKGRGYTFAEENPHDYHGISPFEIETGEEKTNNGLTFSSVFGNQMVKLAEKDHSVVTITAAMPKGTGLDEFSEKYPDRFFDVGIAEQHAVTFAAGLAQNGLNPVVAIYSTFLQRAYDQILHDVAMQNLHVVFAIDRAGIVGEDGETHQGIYDISYLSHIPNIAIASPADYDEFQKLLDYAVLKHKGPIAIRYPRGTGKKKLGESKSIKIGKGEKIVDGTDVSIIAIGNMVEKALKVSEILKNKGISAEVINARFIKPLDESLIIDSISKTGFVVTLEDNIIKGGFGENLLELLYRKGIQTKTALMGYPDEFIQHGSRKELFKKYRLDSESIAADIAKMFPDK